MLITFKAEDPVVPSHLTLRRAFGVVALGFPFALVVSWWILRKSIESSISGYYYTDMRNVLIGGLCAIALYMLCSRSSDSKSSLIEILLSCCILGVAFFPIAPDANATLPQHMIGLAHWSFAILLFSTLAYYCLVRFKTGAANCEVMANERQRNCVYAVCGYLILACMVLAGLLKVSMVWRLVGGARPTLYFESIALIAFGIAWLVKSESLIPERKNDSKHSSAAKFLTHHAKCFARPVMEWRSAQRGAAVALGAICLMWPAFYNGYPLLYPDSMTYLCDGRLVARALFLHQFSSEYGLRSSFYSMGILPLHWNVSPWPVAALQCLMVAWVVWLVMRAFVERGLVRSYLLMILFLSLLSSASWYAVFIMPDILGPVLYISIYLLVFVYQSLSRAERWLLYLIAWWGVTAHASHLPVAAVLCVMLGLIGAVEGKKFHGRFRSVGEVAAVILVAVAAQMMLYGYLYGKPLLFGHNPPTVMSRVIADGPGRWYLEKNCAHLQWVVCNHLANLTDNPDTLLWGPRGTYQAAPESEKRQMEAEQMPLVLGALRAYPRQQLTRAVENFGSQLREFGLYGFNYNHDMLYLGQSGLNAKDDAMHGMRARYANTLQGHDALPLILLSNIEWWVIVCSIVVIVLLIPLIWRRRSPRLAGLSFVIVVVVIANAFVAGVLSGAVHRYQCRVIWLIPLLAGIVLLQLLQQRAPGKEQFQDCY
ncbi:MAG: hypothetical protein ABSC77_04735 [Terracidiphilus sp.]|jgi:hypothetical protein